MCENDFLLTYNPECLDRHSDSSDFDDNETTQSGRRGHTVIRRKLFRYTEMANYEEEMKLKRFKHGYRTDANINRTQCIYENRDVHPRQCNCNECVIPVEEKRSQIWFKKRKVKYCTQDDKRSLHRTPSKLSIVRSKIMPCLSNIFGRSNQTRRENPVKGDHMFPPGTKDHCCQVYCLNCNHKRLKKSFKKHDFIVQSMYSTEDGLDYSPDSGINIYSSTEKETDHNISCDLMSSSGATNIQSAKKKIRKIIQKEFKKAYLKTQNIRRNREQQFPSKGNFQIFSTPKMSKIEHIQSELRDISSFGCNVMPSNSSVFWEYLVERINKKYQTNNRGGLIRSCHCTNTTKCPNANKDPLLHDGTGSQLDYKTNEQATQGSEPYSCKGTPRDSPTPEANRPISPIVSPAISKKGKLGTPLGKENASTSDKPQKVQCKCHPTGASLRATPGGTPSSPGTGLPGSPGSAVKRPCQEPHDQLKDTLEKRYNGEILCIHNPPCILINGCLNLPPVKGQFSPSAWPVTQLEGFHCGYQKPDTPKQIHEQGCQYQPSSCDAFQSYRMENTKTEKMTQSICNHDPPCEVVRCCYKPEFDPKLENSCVHVPMCKKLPTCILNDSDNSSKCDHQPKCPELPVCKQQHKKYIVLTAKEDMSTQVRPKEKMDCKHTPPCIMIPKCLGKLMCEGYVPYDAIPGCFHQPACEMIPACCRKSAKMGTFFKSFGRKQRRMIECDGCK